MAPRDIFVYGTMLDADVRALVLGRVVPDSGLSVASLDGFARRRLADESYPVLVPEPDSAVQGLLLRRLRGADRARMAFFESDEYELRNCRVRLSDGSSVAALYYAEADAMPGACESWSLGWWQARHKARYLAMVAPYMALYGRATIDEADELWQRLNTEQ